VSVNVTWTKLFVYTGIVLAACYGVSDYVAGTIEARIDAWSGTLERVTAQQQALGEALAQLRQAVDAERARADADADRRAQAAAAGLAATEGRLGDRLKALEAALSALHPAAAPPAPASPGPSPAGAATPGATPQP
jgi:uncharacterized membrane protein YccC